MPLVFAASTSLLLTGCAPGRALLALLAALSGSGASSGAALDTALDSAVLDSGVAMDDTGSSGPLLTDTGAAPTDTGAHALDVALLVSGFELPAVGQETTADASYDLSWEGEEIEGSMGVAAARRGSVLVVGGISVRSQVGEDRSVSLSLELPIAEVVVGAQVEGELVYGESPVEPPWLDVVLGAPVTVEVAEDPAEPGLLQLKVFEAPIEPLLGVGVARAGLLYDGPYDLVVDPGVQLDCGALSPDQLAFVSQSLEDLAADQNEAFDPARSYAHLTRAHQGSDPMRPFSAGGDLVETLTSWNGTYALQRVPDSGGLVDLDFLPAQVDGTFGQDYALMEVREGPGLFEVGRRLTIDGRDWDPGFGVVVERFYADTADAAIEEASCIATFEARLEAFSF